VLPPLPRCPFWPKPQHHTVPSPSSAQEKFSPDSTVTTSSNPSTRVGVDVDASFPVPNRPLSPIPQQKAWPEVVAAQVWARPAEMLATCDNPGTWTGVLIRVGDANP